MTALEMFEDLAKVYQAVYAEPPYKSGPLFAANAFQARTSSQAMRPGFKIVAAWSPDQDLVGFSFGLTFPEGRWWSGETTPPPSEILAVPKFAVIELVLLKEWRGNGIGHELLDQLLSGRQESIATLCALPHAPVRKLYERWGWIQMGTSHLAEPSLTLDVLVLPLEDSPNIVT
ncbi:GNAT family N-acetyltransferase [Polymorphospora rubra]|uniref:GNAT family N-acetyltransferase n=1 Tax=Polymorphospora rubra TaxID=338584 RepID=UPI0033D70A31